MRFFKIPTLTPFVISKKNIKKSLLIINIGIFLSIFAASSAIISLFIENKISKYETAIIENKSTTIFFNKLERYFSKYEDGRTRLYDSNNTFTSYNEILRALKNGDALIDDREYYLYRMISEYYGAKEFFDDREFINDIKKFYNIDENELLLSLYDPIVHKKFLEKIKNQRNEIENYEKKYDALDSYVKKIDIFKSVNDKEMLGLLPQNTMDKYYNVYVDLFAINEFLFEYLATFKEIMADWSISNKSYNIENYQEVERLSNLEKQIIIIAFIFQIIIFFVTQFFEITFATKVKKRIIRSKKI